MEHFFFFLLSTTSMFYVYNRVIQRHNFCVCFLTLCWRISLLSVKNLKGLSTFRWCLLPLISACIANHTILKMELHPKLFFFTLGTVEKVVVVWVPFGDNSNQLCLVDPTEQELGEILTNRDTSKNLNSHWEYLPTVPALSGTSYQHRKWGWNFPSWGTDRNKNLKTTHPRDYIHIHSVKPRKHSTSLLVLVRLLM